MFARLAWVIGALLLGVAAAGCNGGGGGSGNDFVAPTQQLSWQKVEIPGTVCGNGSQYKFFVSRSIGGTNSNNLLIYLEPGGACWDYESCIAHTARGAANPNGISDDHMTGGDGVPWALASPLLLGTKADNPVWDWTKVFVPYCTGDVHTGNRTVTYTSPDGTQSTVWHHAGHADVQGVIQWLDQNYPVVPKMLVTGSSAGGVGALSNYYFFRTGISGVQRAYLLDDSGPIFPAPDSTSWSWPLYQKIKDAWGVGTLLANTFPGYDFSDFGNVNDLLAQQFPNDRLAVTFYQLDYNFSLYSYERFQFNAPPRDTLDPSSDAYRGWIYTMWWDDTLALKSRLDQLDNFAYYIPFYRHLNSSHCLTIYNYEKLSDYAGTEIQEDNQDLRSYVEQLLDDSQPLPSYFEQSCDDTNQYPQYPEVAGYAALTPKCQ